MARTSLDDRYVSREYCENKKSQYIRKELCEAKEASLKSDISDIKDSINGIKNNHLAHMQIAIEKMKDDMVDIKVKVALIVTIATTLVQILFLGIQYAMK